VLKFNVAFFIIQVEIAPFYWVYLNGMDFYSEIGVL